MTVRILIADDHQILREGLSSLLSDQPDMEVVGEAENGLDAMAKVQELRPEVVILDILMPRLNGIEATRHLTSEPPGAKVIALSMHSDRRLVAGMLDAGASAYLLKDSAFEELATAVRTVASGQTYLSSGIAGVVVDDYRRRRRAAGGSMSRITPREREVLQLIAEGHSTKRIAAILRLSPKTVETHRKNIMERLDIHSVAELTKYAVREGLTSLEYPVRRPSR